MRLGLICDISYVTVTLCVFGVKRGLESVILPTTACVYHPCPEGG